MTRNRLLVPLDDTDFSRNILGTVRRFFAPADTELVLLRVVPPIEGVMGDALWVATADMPGPLYIPQTALATEAQWADLRQVVADELGHDSERLQAEGYTVTVAVHSGDTVAAIEALIADERIDLVAMATHGRTGISRLFWGSVAEEALHRLHIPFLLLHPAS